MSRPIHIGTFRITPRGELRMMKGAVRDDLRTARACLKRAQRVALGYDLAATFAQICEAIDATDQAYRTLAPRKRGNTK